jgi:hypothetical protein
MTKADLDALNELGRKCRQQQRKPVATQPPAQSTSVAAQPAQLDLWEEEQ